MTALPSPFALERLLAPVARQWWLWLLVGALSIAAGVVAIANPSLSLLAIAILFGCALIINGFFDLLAGLTADDEDALRRVAAVLLGVLALVAGVLVLRRPGRAVFALVLIVGTYLIVAGALRLAGAPGDADARPRLLLGGLDVTLGILILALPAVSLTTFALLFGISLVLRGAVAMWVGIRLRRLAHSAPRARPAAAGP